MKKVILISLSMLVLSSCGAPKIENPDDALKQNQKLVIESFKDMVNIAPKIGTSKGNIKINLEAKEGKLGSNINYDFNFKDSGQKSDGNLKGNFKLEPVEEIMPNLKNISGNIDLNLVNLKNKIFFKLNSLKVNGIEKNPQLSIIPGIIAQFEKKWYFLKKSTNERITYVQENYKQILENLKENTILKFVKENENKDFYDYDVIISEENILKITSKIKNIYTKETENKLTKEEINEMKLKIGNFNKIVKLNIKIDKNNLKFFILTINNKEGNIVIENLKDNFNIKADSKKDKTTFEFIGKKSNKKIDGTISIKMKDEELFAGKTSILYNGTETNLTFEGTAKSNGEEVKMNFEINDKSKEKSVKIEEPKEAKDFNEVINAAMSAMMGGAQLTPKLAPKPIDNIK